MTETLAGVAVTRWQGASLSGGQEELSHDSGRTYINVFAVVKSTSLTCRGISYQ